VASPTISKVLERAAFASMAEAAHGIARVMADKGEPLDPALLAGLS
jgi:2-oxoisovalerate dehydrogenase E1 component